MPRRLRKSRPVIAPDVLRAELAESNAHNRELAAENERLRAELSDMRTKFDKTVFQLDWHRGELSRVKVLLSSEERRVDALQRTASADAAALKKEREHVAGSCSHAADLRAMSQQVAALERRVHELQQASIARDVFELPGWEPVVALPSGPDRKALRRGQG